MRRSIEAGMIASPQDRNEPNMQFSLSSVAARLFAPTREALAVWGVIVFAASLALFLWGHGAARDIYFDETWYVATARTLIKSGEMLHQEHPPLGKLLIASGMVLFGDDPFGWRATSALFGALTLVGTLLWSYALLRSVAQSLWACAVTAFDFVVYVQARIAMLDIFLMAFCVLALAFFTFSFKERRSERRSFVFALLMGVCFGLAGACKLSGLFPLFGVVAVRLLLGLLKLWRVHFEDPRESDFFTPEAWRALTPGKSLLAFVVAPFLAYFATYVPQMLHEGTILEFFASQRRMIAIMTGVSASHPYSSLWFQWPAMTRPVWYLFHIEGGPGAQWSANNPAQAIVGMASPLVLFAGEAAILAAAWRWIARRDTDGMIVTVAFFSQYLPWALNPKGLEFFYYYFPALLSAGPALALAFFRGSQPRPLAAVGFLVASGLLFVFFLPVMSAQFPVDPDAFSRRIWFDFWR
ncbi:MAG TPA: phospholipid carrier-dependent glycosyltransferase [Roseiarcus sp.]